MRPNSWSKAEAEAEAEAKAGLLADWLAICVYVCGSVDRFSVCRVALLFGKLASGFKTVSCLLRTRNAHSEICDSLVAPPSIFNNTYSLTMRLK